jgi:glycosyltransferase involved in cell wall biosynthesis
MPESVSLPETKRRSIRILFDLHASQTLGSAGRGVGRYSKGLFSKVAEICLPREVYGVVSPHLAYLPDLDGVSQAKILRCPPMPDWQVKRDFEGGDQDTLDSLLLSSVVATVRPDIVHVSHVFEGFAERVALPSAAARPTGQVLSATLYDLIPLRFPKHYFASERFEYWYRNRLQWLRQADLLLSISDSTRQDAINLLGLDPDRIVTIYGGISSQFKAASDPDAELNDMRKRYGIYRKNFVLYTGGDDYRKNIQGAIRGFAALPKKLRCDLHFVIVCAMEEQRKEVFMRVAHELGLNEQDVLFLGFVPEDDLVSLYSACAVFIFPSLYEGLGLPVIEAMACGAPTIGGDNSSISELIGRKDAVFDAADPQAIGGCMTKVLTDPGFAIELRKHALARARDFTWDNSARRAIVAFDEALQRKREVGVRSAHAGWLTRPRLAMLTPLPPARSGIADHSAQFLPYLAQHFEIDVYVDGHSVSGKGLISNFRIFHVQSFRSNANAYDVILYEFGNSEFHAHMLSLLEEFPGVVVLHDVFLSGLIGYLEFNLGDKDRYVREMLAAHGSTARHIMAPVQAHNDPTFASMVDLPCIKYVLDRAIGLISHSPFNLETARHFHPEGWRAPFRIIPQMIAIPEAWTEEHCLTVRAQLGFGEDDIVIATFGHVAWTKLGDRILEAFVHSELASNEQCHLVFVGELAKDDFGDRLGAQIRKAGLGDRVKVTGFLPESNYERYLRVADVAIQLRTKSRGGTPRGVLDCMAHGVPVIVNDEASYRDYPEDVVFRLSSEPAIDEIAHALEELSNCPDRRSKLARRGLEYVRQHHNPNLCASQYAAAIHEFIDGNKASHVKNYVSSLAPHLAACPDRTQACRLAGDFLDARPTPHFVRPRLFIDVSHIVKEDHATGIPRIVKEIVRAAYCRAQPGVDTVAVARMNDGLFEATDWLAARGLLFPHETEGGSVRSVTFRRGDHLLMLDSSWHEYGEFEAVFAKARQALVPITTAIYDLLPLTLPPGNIVEGGKEWFEGWLRQAIAQSDALVCISRAAADEVVGYVVKHGLGRPGLKIGYWHLGSDFTSRGDCTVYGPSSKVNLRPYCLMVGTIEPRKNHALALDAFERLWNVGSPLNLVIAGKPGWLVDQFIDQLRTHEQLNRRLFFFEGSSDADLAYLYSNAAALLFISKGEGFGLPLVEAAHYGTPIICSDIPVFREIAGDHAYYVSIEGSRHLAKGIVDWWARYQTGNIPQSCYLQRLSWAESMESLLNVVLRGKWYWIMP